MQDIETYGKLPPQALEMERAVLGAIMLEAGTMDTVVRIVKHTECFYRTEHELIYSAMVELWLKGSPIDQLTVTNQLKKKGSLDAAGGPYFIVCLTNEVGSSANVEYHAEVIKGMWLKRKSISMGTEIAKRCYDDMEDPYAALENFIGEANELLSGALTAGEKTFAEMIDDFDEDLHNHEVGLGITSGLETLDKMTGGWYGGNLIILSGRPSEGKSTIALQNACALCKLGHAVGFFSLEMNRMELIQKIICQEAAIDLENLRRKSLTGDEWARYKRAKEAVKKWKLYICDVSGIPINEATSIIAGWVAVYKIVAVFFDFIQLATVPDNVKRVSTRDQEVGLVSRKLKGVAMKFNIPVIALSSMSRKIEDKHGKARRPDNSDLRDSGSLESDANMVVFVYRPELHGITALEDGTPTENLTEIIITKNRMGRRCTVAAYFDGKHSRFTTDRYVQPPDYGQGNNSRQIAREPEDEEMPF